MEHLPAYISIVFGLTTVVTIWLFYKATGYASSTLLTILLWVAVQSVVAATGFYTNTVSMPPRFMLLVLPPMVMIVLLFITARGRRYIDKLNIKVLTILHVIRVPVEIVLLWLMMNKAVPKIMTFEGQNLDVLSGLTAPLIYYLAFVRRKLNMKVLLLWNIVTTALLVNIVVTAVLSLPYPFQKYGFEQPNIGLLYFPFVLLPAVIVPIVLLLQLVVIRKAVLARMKKMATNRREILHA